MFINILEKYKHLFSDNEYNSLTINNISNNNTNLEINFTTNLTKLNNINLTIEINENNITISLFFSSLVNNDCDYDYYKLELVKNTKYNNDYYYNTEIINQDNYEVIYYNIYFDGKLINCIKEEDVEDENEDEDNENDKIIWYQLKNIDNIDILQNFSYFLNDFPFKNKNLFEENDGLYYYSKELKPNNKNITLLFNWIKTFIKQI